MNIPLTGPADRLPAAWAVVREAAARGLGHDEIVLKDGALHYRPGGTNPAQVALLAALTDRVAAGESPVLPSGEPVPQLWQDALRVADDAPERHQVIADRARAEPDRVAVVAGDQQITYGELNARADRLAARLTAHGVGPDVPVALILPAGIDLIMSMLAVLKAGGCYLPISPANPPSRTAYLLADAEAAVVIADPSADGAYGPRPLITPAEAGASSGEDPAEPTSSSNSDISEISDRLGYLLYTSGSTGEPKGVAVRERAVGNLLRATARHLSLGPGDAALFSSAPIFDISTVEIFLPLMCGARVVVASRDQSRTPSELVRLIDAHDVTLVQATPSAWRPLTDALAPGGRRERLQALTAGEPLTPDLAARLLAVAGTVINGYGPTETTIYSTIATISDPDDVTIGGPVDGTSLYVVDERGRPLPAGVPGELLIGGAGLARGYRNRPELTSERFVPGPTGETVYRTGDLVWCAPDGRLRALGRIDGQVKVRGHRIEPGEVQARLDAHPDIKVSAVRAREFGPDDTRLVAFVVTADGVPLPLAEMRDWCAETLPEHLIPTICLTLPELPQNASGKLDERALPDSDQVRATLAASGDTTERVEPRTPAERAVARIWAEALWADDLSVHDDFFELGGDSLVATQVTMRLQQEFVLDVPFGVIFRWPTVAELAAELVRARAAGGFDAARLSEGRPGVPA